MIANVTTTFLKAEKAFKQEKYSEAKKLLNKVIDHDKDFYTAYLLLYDLYNIKNSPQKNVIYKELKRLNLDLDLDHKPINIKSKKNRKNPKLATLSLIKLMTAQGKKIQAKKNLKLIVKHSNINKNVIKAEEMLKDL
jgi:tetratricopeptide (TPR) repeat protein